MTEDERKLLQLLPDLVKAAQAIQQQAPEIAKGIGDAIERLTKENAALLAEAGALMKKIDDFLCDPHLPQPLPEELARDVAARGREPLSKSTITYYGLRDEGKDPSTDEPID